MKSKLFGLLYQYVGNKIVTFQYSNINFWRFGNPLYTKEVKICVLLVLQDPRSYLKNILAMYTMCCGTCLAYALFIGALIIGVGICCTVFLFVSLKTRNFLL